MVNIYTALEADKSAEEAGVKVEIYPGIFVTVRSSSSKTVREKAMSIARNQRRLLLANNGVLPVEIRDRNEVELCATAVLVSWDGVTDREGKPLPFNADNARQVLTDLPQFRRLVLDASEEPETFRKAALEALVGNSQTASAGNSNTNE